MLMFRFFPILEMKERQHTQSIGAALLQFTVRTLPFVARFAAALPAQSESVQAQLST